FARRFLRYVPDFFARDLRQRRDHVAFAQVHHAHALGVAADHADFAHRHPRHHALGGDQHYVVAYTNREDADHRAVALAGADVADAAAAAALPAVAHRRTVLRLLFLTLGRLGGFGLRRFLHG